ncbi:MAG: TetR/AcrR family transcriptional regulator [Halolamina sp.]|uniref:TetR/AcrR family transcriptional regulator n=1 Tax=Halolamina sp. TaxID=1940283 RepID=UPI002FC34D1F
MVSEQTTADITDATYRALCKHGYADVTMEDIAAETERSKSALHYHYDSKHDLLCSFLDELFDSFTERLESVEAETPHEGLLALIDEVLRPAEADGPPRDFEIAVLEMKAQSPYDETFRDRLAEFDQKLTEHIAGHLAAGVEAGEFRTDLDVSASADFLVTVINGAHTRSVAIGRPVEETRETLARHIETMIAVEEDSR